ncbi:MAG: hypothetical protein M3Y40_08535, partial [Chloroflexota bacterium]|nr:hypothetical protein [Chloroflexota bacterium]
ASPVTQAALVDAFGPVVEVGDALVVVTVVEDMRGITTVEAVDPATARTRSLHRVADGAHVSHGDLLDLRMDVPDGFVYVVEMTPREGGAVQGVDDRHLLISVAEGRAIEIPAPAFRDPRGFGTQG